MKKSRRPTMKDVAELAGVSAQTVSFVINEIPVVTPETRERVVAAIEELNYTPNAAARSLRSGRTGIIGLMIPDAHNPHFWDTVRGAEDEAAAHGYSLLLATTSMDRERERRAFDVLARQRLDAIIPLFTYPEEFIRALRNLHGKHMPVALSVAGEFAAALNADADVVQVDFSKAAQQLMTHLLGLGHRRIGMIWGVGRSELANDRVSAYKEGLAGASLPFDPSLLVLCGHGLEDAFHAAEQLLNLRPIPTAIVGINDLMALGALQAALRRGLRVPQDLSVAGFDDIPLSRLVAPPMTTGAVDGREIGRQLVRLALQRLQNPDLPPQYVKLSTHLIVRQSTGPVPVDLGKEAARSQEPDDSIQRCLSLDKSV